MFDGQISRREDRETVSLWVFRRGCFLFGLGGWRENLKPIAPPVTTTTTDKKPLLSGVPLSLTHFGLALSLSPSLPLCSTSRPQKQRVPGSSNCHHVPTTTDIVLKLPHRTKCFSCMQTTKNKKTNGLVRLGGPLSNIPVPTVPPGTTNPAVTTLTVKLSRTVV